jgi:hypothetical protein
MTTAHCIVLGLLAVVVWRTCSGADGEGAVEQVTTIAFTGHRPDKLGGYGKNPLAVAVVADVCAAWLSKLLGW